MLLSTLAERVHSGTNLTTVRIGNRTLLLTSLPNHKLSLGGSLAEIVPEGGGVVEVLTLVFQRGSLLSHTNDNYLNGPTVSLVNQVQLDPQCQDKNLSVCQNLKSYQTVNKPLVPKTLNLLGVCCPVVNPVRTILSHGHPQKKGASPGNCLNKIKHVKGVCCVNPCVFAPIMSNVPNAVAGQNVGGRLQQFWHIWLEMGANPRVVSVLRDGYTLPFKNRPCLTRIPLIQSGYASPTKNMYLKDALVSLMHKLVVEKVGVKSSLAFYN